MTGDVLRLRQILLNLLGNAIKFTSDGQVRLRVEMGEGGSGICFDVCDTGPGINPEQRKRLFRRFDFHVENPGKVRPAARLTTRPTEQITCRVARAA